MCRIFFFLAKVFNKLVFFSVIIIVFLLLSSSFNKLLLTNVSRVLPDFEIIIIKLCFKFTLFFIFLIFIKSKLSKNINFFFILFLQKEYIAFAPRAEPPIPIKVTVLNLLNLIRSEYLKSKLNFLLRE